MSEITEITICGFPLDFIVSYIQNNGEKIDNAYHDYCAHKAREVLDRQFGKRWE